MAENVKPDYIEFFLTDLGTDPVQYKPYSPHYSPVQALVLQIPFDPELILDYDACDGDGVIVLGIDGFKALLRTMAGMIQEAHKEFQEDMQNYYRRTA